MVTQQRRSEIGFGLAVLLVPLALLLLVEAVAQARNTLRDNTAFDWVEMRESAPAPEDRDFGYQANGRYKHVSFNQFGLRGPEVTLPKPQDRVRIAFLGDSMMFAAFLEESQTVPGQLQALVQSSRPDCTFDYVNFSGPSYQLGFLAEHWPEIKEIVSPDVVIVSAGSAYEAFQGPSTRRKPSERSLIERVADRLEGVELFRIALRRVSAPRRLLPGSEEMPGFEGRIQENWATMGDALALLGDAQSTLVVGHRFVVRSESPPDELTQTTRHLRNTTGIKSAESALDLTEDTLSTMAAYSQKHGFAFVDAIVEVPPDRTHFRDPLHFTARGAGVFAEALLGDVLELLPSCGARQTDQTQ